MRHILLILTTLPLFLFSQTTVTIPQIQGTGTTSTYSGQTVKTTGVVTAKFIGTGKINGYFLQDETEDGNTATSDGIFVYSTTDNVTVGDKVQVTATVSEYNGRTQLSNVSAKTLISSNVTITPAKVQYNGSSFTKEQYEGMLVEFNQTLYVTNNSGLQQYGQLSLSPFRKYNPTNQFYPATAECINLASQNAGSTFLLDDGLTSTYPATLLFADASSTRRTGERIKNLKGIVDDVSGSMVVYPYQTPQFFGNPRPATVSNLGNYNLKVCAFNVEYYLTTNYGQGYGANNTIEAARQHTKIMAALLAIDADIYGLIEIEQGQDALIKLVSALNTATVAGRFAYINDGGTINGTYTKVGYIYRTDKVTPYLNLQNNNSVGPTNRKKAQAFTLKSNNQRFIFSLNHFKAKSGCSSASGGDADSGDGQSCYNYTRVNEANSTISNSTTWKNYYGDNDVLIMGDLNAYGREDPVKTLINAGYADLHRAFHADSSYSYMYNSEAGYLDNALVSPTMLPQVSGMQVFHINADEPGMFGYAETNYQPDMYRCSDHDPVVVGLALGMTSLVAAEKNNRPSVTQINNLLLIENAAQCELEIFNSTGQLVTSNHINEATFEVQLKEHYLNQGMYILKITDNKKTYTQKILLH